MAFGEYSTVAEAPVTVIYVAEVSVPDIAAAGGIEINMDEVCTKFKVANCLIALLIWKLYRNDYVI